MTWEEAIEHPSLRNLPFKIELNGDGNVVMSETNNRRGFQMAEIACWLCELLPHGNGLISAGVQTSDNVKVADVAWLTPEHWCEAQHAASCATAPAICVDVACKPDWQREFSVRKILYFEAGAQEVWFCDTAGNLTFYTTEGEVTASVMCPDFPRTV